MYGDAPTLKSHDPIPTAATILSSDFARPDTYSSINELSNYRPPANTTPPPLVFITPPGSPVPTNDRYSAVDSSPSTSESARTSTGHRRKKFYIVNPDPDEEDPSNNSSRPRPRARPYVYHPPPLPDIHPGPVPRLFTSASMSQLSAGPSQVHARSQSQSSSRGSSATYVGSASSSKDSPVPKPKPPAPRNDRYSDSDSDSDVGTSYWKKLPQDFGQSSTAKNIPRKSQRKSNRISRIESKRDSAWARPFVEDVYQHIDEFFPDHDIDKPIIGAGVAENNRAKRKTIRMVAEERLGSKSAARVGRRHTKLWGSHTQEVKAPDSPALL